MKGKVFFSNFDLKLIMSFLKAEAAPVSYDILVRQNFVWFPLIVFFSKARRAEKISDTKNYEPRRSGKTKKEVRFLHCMVCVILVAIYSKLKSICDLIDSPALSCLNFRRGCRGSGSFACYWCTFRIYYSIANIFLQTSYAILP